MSIPTAITTSPFSGMNLKILGRKDYQITWFPDNFGLLDHRSKLTRYLDEVQITNEGPRPNICILLKDQSAVMIHSEVALAYSGYLRIRYANEVRMQGRRTMLTINELTDYDANAVRRMVNFFYSGILPCSLAEIPELLVLCNKLQVISMRPIIEKFIIQKAVEPNCLLDCWNISCHKQSDFSKRTRDFVLGYVIQNLEEAVLDSRFPQLDQGAVEALLLRENLPVRSEADVLRIALIYHLRRKGSTNTQSLLNVVRYNCSDEILIQMRQDIMSINDEMLCHCFEQNCAYGMWQLRRHQYTENIWPATEMLPPRGHLDANCAWIVPQLASLTGIDKQSLHSST